MRGSPRVVVFEVSGVIRGDIRITHPFITVAGQTAPGAGITVEGMLRASGRSQVHDVIVRFLRLRPRPVPGHSGDAVQMGGTRRVILDHCSMSWAVDETIDIITASDWTVQWCAVEESDPRGHSKGVPHNYGFLAAYAGTGNISLHHNLFDKIIQRTPRARYGQVHVYNNYYRTQGEPEYSYSWGVGKESMIYAQNNAFSIDRSVTPDEFIAVYKGTAIHESGTLVRGRRHGKYVDVVAAYNAENDPDLSEDVGWTPTLFRWIQHTWWVIPTVMRGAGPFCR